MGLESMVNQVTETHFYNNLNNQNKAEIISVTKPFPNNEFSMVIWHGLPGKQCPSLIDAEKSVFYPIFIQIYITVGSLDDTTM
jgi:hypothetical protein